MKLKLKWITICVLLCLICSVVSGLIYNDILRQVFCILIGGLCGQYCLMRYTDEKHL